MQKFYLGELVGTSRGAVGSVVTSIMTVLYLCLTSRGLLEGVKGRFCALHICSVLLYGSEDWPAKENEVIRLERNSVVMVRMDVQ